MQKGIKNIIFDLGNVLMDLDFYKVNTAFQELVGADFYQLVDSEETKNIFLQFEIGHYSEESFINALQRLSPKVPDGRKVIEAWNTLLVGIPPQRLEMLTILKEKGYQLYLLSNTNSLHIQWLNKYMKDTYDIEGFDQRFFVKSYYSYLINMRKPNQEIFEFVLADAFIKAEETLFIDDTKTYTLSAQKLGIATIHHNSAFDITEVMQRFIE
jgi:glucose-1-phosphatase